MLALIALWALRTDSAATLPLLWLFTGACWLPPSPTGNQRCAVNLRMAEPAQVNEVPLRRFDGHDTWASLPADGRTVGEVWF